MARSPGTPATFVAVLLILIVSASLATCVQGRKVLETSREETSVSSSVDPRLFLDALPKGRIPVSSPSRKGYEATINEELIARHLASLDRILRSVPSPGVGH
ncbi:hypothetical protein MLD38_019282 [Melastoma candidum]|uniref:Uncharacterized protein n=1 Tax=Melastoma candidum TaxID=119954 RepID=A0ACB9QZL6_9MYRT|nr:hypothetical protein MLD38_019282 [Melastoma candidum]